MGKTTLGGIFHTVKLSSISEAESGNPQYLFYGYSATAEDTKIGLSYENKPFVIALIFHCFSLWIPCQ